MKWWNQTCWPVSSEAERKTEASLGGAGILASDLVLREAAISEKWGWERTAWPSDRSPAPAWKLSLEVCWPQEKMCELLKWLETWVLGQESGKKCRCYLHCVSEGSCAVFRNPCCLFLELVVSWLLGSRTTATVAADPRFSRARCLGAVWGPPPPHPVLKYPKCLV